MKEKEKLVSELLLQTLPSLLPKIFPESKELLWLDANYFKPKEILECEERKEELKKNYDEQLKKILEQEKQIYEQNEFFQIYSWSQEVN